MATSSNGSYWRDGKSLVECFRYLLNNGQYSDVTFNVSSNGHKSVQLRALRSVLVARSEVFEKMFLGELQETQNVIEITDIQPDAFYELLRFIYTDEVKLTGDNVFSVLYVSKKYMMSVMTTRCEEYLQQNLDVDNATSLLEQSILFDALDLQERCMKLIQEQTDRVLTSEAFLHAGQDTVKRILQSDEMNVQDEMQVFNASVAWGKSQCQVQGIEDSNAAVKTALGDLKYLIRFPTMTQEQFADQVLPSELLDNAESLQMLKYFCCKEKPSSLPFSQQRRAKQNSCGLEIGVQIECPECTYTNAVQADTDSVVCMICSSRFNI